MFESAEIGRSIDKETYEAEAPALREALLEAQYELQQQGRFAVIILISALSLLLMKGVDALQKLTMPWLKAERKNRK